MERLTYKGPELPFTDDLSAAISTITTLTAENAQLRAELEQVKRERDAYMCCSKDLLSKGNCNECGDKENCNYRPRPGETVRANCPLWRAPQKEE